VSSVPLQQTLRHQHAAFVNFFAGRAEYPRFKSRQGRQSATFTRSAFRWRDGRWYVSLTLDVADAEQAPAEGGAVGVDLGLKDFAVLSTGEKIAHPRSLAQRERNLALSLGTRHWTCPACGTPHDRNLGLRGPGSPPSEQGLVKLIDPPTGGHPSVVAGYGRTNGGRRRAREGARWTRTGSSRCRPTSCTSGR
jgi:transposase